jgi:peroxiredoxin
MKFYLKEIIIVPAIFLSVLVSNGQNKKDYGIAGKIKGMEESGRISNNVNIANEYEILGKLRGMEDGGKVYMVLSNSTGYHSFGDYLVRQDSATITNGEFHLKGVVPEGPRRYLLQIMYAKNKMKTIDFWIAKGEKITITSDQPLDSIMHTYIEHYVTFSGSPTAQSRLLLDPTYQFYYQTMVWLDNSIQKLQDSIGFNPAFVGTFLSMKERLNDLIHWVVFWPHDLDPDRKKAQMVFLQLHYTSGHASFWADVYNNLTEQEKSSFNGKWLKELVNISVGQPFPEFKLPASDGKIVSSKDIIAKSKITLVHFWSANSSDRKKYQDEIRFMYKKYRDKGLNVIGLFHDDTNYNDLNAYTSIDVKKQYADILKDENHPWLNVADFDYKNGPVETIYREGGANNTTNVIIDANGKILAWDVKGAELQYYLWKAFGE